MPCTAGLLASLCLLLSFPGATGLAEILTGPNLRKVTKESITIMWEGENAVCIPAEKPHLVLQRGASWIGATFTASRSWSRALKR